MGPGTRRHVSRTLRATLDWSFDLLEPDEQDAFTALGAFAGGCELDAAEAVTGASLDVLEGLATKNLVSSRDGRLFLLEPVRQYAAERLTARADVEAIHGRHHAHFLALAEQAEAELWARGRSASQLAAMRRELDSFAVALERVPAGGRAVDALALAGALGPLGWFTNASEWVRSSCAHALTAAGDDAARCSHWATRAPIRCRIQSASVPRSPRFRIWATKPASSAACCVSATQEAFGATIRTVAGWPSRRSIVLDDSTTPH